MPATAPRASRSPTVDNGGGDDFDPAVTSIVLDTNGNGAYDAGVDTVYVAGANDPELDARRSRSRSSSSRPSPPAPATASAAGSISTAVAATGSGAPGTSFAGQGQGGGDAVVGATGADAEDDGYYRVAAASVAFVKSATVADPFGGTASVPGAIITYTLAATVGGTRQPRQSAGQPTPIPAGTTYRPARSRSTAAPLTDAADADAGQLHRQRHRRRASAPSPPAPPAPSRSRSRSTRRRQKMKIFLALLALLAPAAAWRPNEVALDQRGVRRARSGRTRTASRGSSARRRGVVTPGDKLVFVLSYRNDGAAPATGFVVTNPIPTSVAFAGGESAGAIVSVDGGKSWGALAALQGRAMPTAPAVRPRPPTSPMCAGASRQPIAAGQRRRAQIQRRRKIDLVTRIGACGGMRRRQSNQEWTRTMNRNMRLLASASGLAAAALAASPAFAAGTASGTTDHQQRQRRLTRSAASTRPRSRPATASRSTARST